MMKKFALFASSLMIGIIFGGCILSTNSNLSASASEKEQNPEIYDGIGDAKDSERKSDGSVSHLDILAAWFYEESPSTLLITIKIRKIYSLESGTDYAVRWSFGGTRYFAWACVDEGKTSFEYGDHAEGHYIKMGEAIGEIVKGEPAYVKIRVPISGIGSPDSGSHLENPDAITHRDNSDGSENIHGVDFTGTGNDFVFDGQLVIK
jgi:hypothetical protein